MKELVITFFLLCSVETFAYTTPLSGAKYSGYSAGNCVVVKQAMESMHDYAQKNIDAFDSEALEVAVVNPVIGASGYTDPSVCSIGTIDGLLVGTVKAGYDDEITYLMYYDRESGATVKVVRSN